MFIFLMTKTLFNKSLTQVLDNYSHWGWNETRLGSLGSEFNDTTGINYDVIIIIIKAQHKKK